MLKEELKRITEENTSRKQTNEFAEKIEEGSQKKKEQIIQALKEIAGKGYGAALFDLCRTFDIFNIVEKKERQYSAQRVLDLLNEEGVSLHIQRDNYDQITYSAIWSREHPLCTKRIPADIEN